MKKKKNVAAKVMAIIALLAIVIGIIGTGIIVIASSLSSGSQQELSQEDIQKYINSFSGSTLTGSDISPTEEEN